MSLPALQFPLDLLYPARCVSCWAFGDDLCPSCDGRLDPATGDGRCPNCAARWDGELNCPRCYGWDALDGALAAFDMDGPARRVVHGLKYRGIRSLAPLMAVRMEPLRPRAAADAVFAAPLHRSRKRRRGFNQSELVLDHLCPEWPRGPGELRRIRRTGRQVGLGQRDRWGNMAGAFVYEGPSLAGMAVAVLDDVVTTGATANECARVLKDAGARRVVAVAFARASYETAGPRDPIYD